MYNAKCSVFNVQVKNWKLNIVWLTLYIMNELKSFLNKNFWIQTASSGWIFELPLHCRLFRRCSAMNGGKSGQHRAACFLTGRDSTEMLGYGKCHRKVNYPKKFGFIGKRWKRTVRAYDAIGDSCFGKPQALKNQIGSDFAMARRIPSGDQNG